MDILAFILFFIVLAICGFYEYKYYKRAKLKADEKEKFIKSLESRLACVEQRLWELEKNYENHIIEN